MLKYYINSDSKSLFLSAHNKENSRPLCTVITKDEFMVRNFLTTKICCTALAISDIANPSYARTAQSCTALCENIIQLREFYWSKQEDRQNKFMGILTIITTLFLPLTLLTGWYGMNFKYMPELGWRYGYTEVIVAAALIAIAEIIYFKKKKIF